jgi:hypothetical protein
MFGPKMTHNGKATVVMSTMIDNGRVKYDGGHRVHRYDLILDVVPEGGAPFRAEASEWFAPLMSPSTGHELRVRCNPEARKVEVDVKDDVRFNPTLHDKAQKHQQEEERRRLLEGGPGSS